MSVLALDVGLDVALDIAPSRRRVPFAPARSVGSLGLAAAGVAHFVAAVDHRDSATAAAFFVAAGIVQVGIGIAWLRGPSRRVGLVAAATTVFLLGAWAVSRTVGIAIGHAHGPEPVGALDVVVVAAELVTLFAAAVTAPRRRLWQALGGAAAVLLALTGVAVSAASRAPAVGGHGHGAADGAYGNAGDRPASNSVASVTALHASVEATAAPDHGPCHGDGCAPHAHP